MKIVNRYTQNLSVVRKLAQTKSVKATNFNIKVQKPNKEKYLPAFSKEWRNIIYSFNKNNLKNLGSNTLNINKIIKSYFNLFYNGTGAKAIAPEANKINKKRSIRKIRSFLNRIYVSDADIKYTNNKAKITLYTINKEKKALKEKYYKLKRTITSKLFTKYSFLHKKIIKNLHFLLQNRYEIKDEYLLLSNYISKKKFIQYKLKYLQSFLLLNQLLLKKVWSYLIKNQSIKYFTYLRKYDLLYSLNQFKFNKFRLLSKLSYLLQKILGKKLEYNIINLKSIAYHPDIFTYLLALKIKRERLNPRRRVNYILHKSNLLQNNKIEERSAVTTWDKMDSYKIKYRDLKVISHIKPKKHNLSSLFNNILVSGNNTNVTANLASYANPKSNNIENFIFDSIGYKNLAGVRIKVSGRLTKRYRADRAIKTLKWKGGLKNIDSSFKRLNTSLFRGNTNSNVSYSLCKSKRRIGSFAVKGWIAGK